MGYLFNAEVFFRGGGHFGGPGTCHRRGGPRKKVGDHWYTVSTGPCCSNLALGVGSQSCFLPVFSWVPGGPIRFGAGSGQPCDEQPQASERQRKSRGTTGTTVSSSLSP